MTPLPTILRALRVYGPERQLLKASEECAECSAAVVRYLGDGLDPVKRDHLAEEVADVEIMMLSVRQIVGDASVDRWIDAKLCRLEGRMNAEVESRR